MKPGKLIKFVIWLGFVAPTISFAGRVTVWPDRRCVEELTTANLDPRVNQGYEILVAEAYLRARPDIREDITIASTIMGSPLPAFDGFVTNARGNPVANISIKGVRVASDRHEFAIPPVKIAAKITELVEHSAELTASWCEEFRWDRLGKYSRRELAEQIARNPTPSLIRRKTFLDTAVYLFSIPTSKTGVRTRILISISDMKGTLQFAEDWQIPHVQIANVLAARAHEIESVTILAKNKTWEFKSKVDPAIARKHRTPSNAPDVSAEEILTY